MFDVIVAGGQIIDGTGVPRYRADVGIKHGRVTAVARLDGATAKVRIDATGKVVTPGLIDAHVHGDLRLLVDPFHEPAIRQGVTTYILGQDGVAMAPGSPETQKYMRQYTAGFNGNLTISQQWETLAEYLACLDRRCALNVAALVPNGNVRMDAMGLDKGRPNGEQLASMKRLVRQAMEDGAVGLSTGLDYIPSLYADTDELIELCKEIAPFGGVYVTHMRRYDPAGVLESMDEVFRIGREAGVAVHISHFNSRAEIVLPKVDAGIAEGLEVTYDLYCYLAGSSILAMIALPPWVQEGGIEATLQRLHDPALRDEIRSWADERRGPLEDVRLSYVAAEDYRDCEGMTLGQAAEEAGEEVIDFVCEILVASRLAVGCIAPHRQRSEADIEALMRHPAMMGGSDGIFVGGCPHPRGCSCFARYLGYYVRERQVWTLEEAVQHLAAHPAARFGLRDRGLLRPGMAADVAVFDPNKITDQATFEQGQLLATGMEHVIVNGEIVMTDGKRTTALPGRALRPVSSAAG